jgi:hypothetical protein
MDKTTAIVVSLGILAIAFIAFFLIFRNKGKGKIKGPWGMGIDVEGSNETTPQPGVDIKDAQSGGSIRVKDATGKGVVAQKLKADGDIEVSSSPGTPPKK